MIVVINVQTSVKLYIASLPNNSTLLIRDLLRAISAGSSSLGSILNAVGGIENAVVPNSAATAGIGFLDTVSLVEVPQSLVRLDACLLVSNGPAKIATVIRGFGFEPTLFRALQFPNRTTPYPGAIPSIPSCTLGFQLSGVKRVPSQTAIPIYLSHHGPWLDGNGFGGYIFRADNAIANNVISTPTLFPNWGLTDTNREPAYLPGPAGVNLYAGNKESFVTITGGLRLTFDVPDGAIVNQNLAVVVTSTSDPIIFASPTNSAAGFIDPTPTIRSAYMYAKLGQLLNDPTLLIGGGTGNSDLVNSLQAGPGSPDLAPYAVYHDIQVSTNNQPGNILNRFCYKPVNIITANIPPVT